MTPGCPTADELAAVVAGAGSAATDDHLGGCPACQTRLAVLTDDPVADRARRAVVAGLIDRDSTLPGSNIHGPVPGWPGPDTRTVPGYEIGRELGRGGMGVVYLARQVRVGRQVALKLMTGNSAATDWVERFEREAVALGRVRHPNIVLVHDAGTADGHPFLAMEYIDGGSLGDKLRAGPLPVREAAAVVRDAARGVAAAHAAGVVHRDLKPSNVLLQPGPDGPVAKVSDFGLAKMADLPFDATRSGQPMGTPGYMAPEQTGLVRGAVGPGTDVYGLGAVLYEALTGLPPLREDSPLKTMMRVATADPVRPGLIRTDAPRDLETICLKCLEKGPGKRYPSAAALADDLTRFLDGRPVTARPVGMARRAGKWAARRPTAAALAAVCAAGSAAGLVGWAKYTADIRTALGAESQANTRARDALAAEQAANARTRAALDALSSEHLQSLLQARPTPTTADRKYLVGLKNLYQTLADDGGDSPEARTARVEGLIRIGAIQRKLGELAEAEGTLRKAVADAPAGVGVRGRAVRELAYVLGDKNRSADLVELVQTLRAEGEAAGPAKTAADADERAMMGLILGNALLALKRYPDAVGAYTAAVAAADAWPADPGCRERAYRAASWVGEALTGAGRPAPAEKAYRDTLPRVRAWLRDHPADVPALMVEAEVLGDLAGLVWSRGRHPEAEAYHKEAIGVLTRAADVDKTDPNPRFTLAQTRLLFGRRVRAAGRAADAEAMFRDALPGAAQLTADFPGFRRYAPLQARLQTEIAQLRLAANDPKAAADFADRAAAVVRPWLDRPEVRAEAAGLIAAALRVKAEALEKTLDPAGAAAAYRAAADLAPGAAAEELRAAADRAAGAAKK